MANATVAVWRRTYTTKYYVKRRKDFEIFAKSCLSLISRQRRKGTFIVFKNNTGTFSHNFPPQENLTSITRTVLTFKATRDNLSACMCWSTCLWKFLTTVFKRGWGRSRIVGYYFSKTYSPRLSVMRTIWTLTWKQSSVNCSILPVKNNAIDQ